jgi:V/A-type H+/Na+-transporting ATPase subunit E
MNIQVKELIEKIKNEGIFSAESEAKKIIAAAEEKAAQMIKKAAAEADSYKLQAESEIKKKEAAGREALKQAARDILIGLEKQITKQFEAVISESVGAALSTALTEKLIQDLVAAWSEKGAEGMKIVLSSSEAKELGDGLKAKLANRFKEGIEIIPSPKVAKGFRIGGSDGALYDFTREGIAEILAEALTPELAETLKEALKE